MARDMLVGLYNSIKIRFYLDGFRLEWNEETEGENGLS